MIMSRPSQTSTSFPAPASATPPSAAPIVTSRTDVSAHPVDKDANSLTTPPSQTQTSTASPAATEPQAASLTSPITAPTVDTRTSPSPRFASGTTLALTDICNEDLPLWMRPILSYLLLEFRGDDEDALLAAWVSVEMKLDGTSVCNLFLLQHAWQLTCTFSSLADLAFARMNVQTKSCSGRSDPASFPSARPSVVSRPTCQYGATGTSPSCRNGEPR